MLKGKPAIKSKGRKKSSKSGDALTKKALATVEANIARIEANERGEKSPPKKPETKTTKTGKNGTTGKEKAPKAKSPKVKRVSGLDLAANALASSKQPLDAKTIADKAIAAGWKTSGKTPHATLYSAIIREISEKGKDARFKKVDRGRFAIARKAV